MTATAYFRATRRRLAKGWQRSRYLRIMPQFVRANPVPVRAALPDEDWRCERLLRTVSDVSVYIMRSGHGDSGVLKVAATTSSVLVLLRERDVLAQLSSDGQLGDWRTVLPVVLAAGEAGRSAYLLTSQLPGRDGRQLAREEMGGLTSAAIQAISPLHQRTRNSCVIDDALMSQLVDEPAELITTALPGEESVVSHLARELRSDLAGRTVTLGLTHGDFSPGNILIGSDGRVTGIVDWGDSREHDLLVLDIAFWLLTLPGIERAREFGRQVAHRLDRGLVWTPAERLVLSGVADGDSIDGRTLLLLTWLRHVASNLGKSARYAESPLWSRRNVIPVLRQVAHD